MRRPVRSSAGVVGGRSEERAFIWYRAASRANRRMTMVPMPRPWRAGEGGEVMGGVVREGARAEGDDGRPGRSGQLGRRQEHYLEAVPAAGSCARVVHRIASFRQRADAPSDA
jgi:hypothetical protein